MSTINVAFVAEGTAFNPAVHAGPAAAPRLDGRPLAVSVKHGEWKRRTANLSFAAGTQLGAAVHISISGSDGTVTHVFYGALNKSPNGLRGQVITAEYEAIDPDDQDKQRALLAGPLANPILVVPQIEKPQDDLDAGVILKATTIQMEFDKSGVPFLASIFGDPNKLLQLDGSHLTMDNLETSDDDAPPIGCVVQLTLASTQRRYVPVIDVGAKVQAQFNRIGQHYGLNGAYAANFTLTHSFLDEWPQVGSTIGNSFVISASYIVATDGTGAYPKTKSQREEVKIMKRSGLVSGLPSDLDDQQDPDDAFTGGSTINAQIMSTGFSAPILQAFGVIAKPRRESILIEIPFDGQELKPGNAAPSYVTLQAQDLDKDPTILEWQSEFEYSGGDVALGNGIPWICNIDHISQKSLLQDAVETDPHDVNYGQVVWSPYNNSNAPIGPSLDVSQIAMTPFGQRCIQYAVRRGIADIALQCRSVKISARMSIDDAKGLDPSWTLRFVNTIFKGGLVEGKVSSLELVADLRNGDFYADVTIACAIGNGNKNGHFGNGDGGTNDAPPAGSTPVATQGGDWDLVNYSVQPYNPPMITADDEIARASVDWLGVEQQWALSNPGQAVWNPNSKYGNGVRSTYYGGYQDTQNQSSAQQFLEDNPTKVKYTIATGEEADPQPVPVTVAVTYGWRGPKQIEL